MKRTRAQKDADERAEMDRKLAEAQTAADKRHDQNGPPVGCGANSCDVAPPQGMAPNGGCNCTNIKARCALRWYRYEYERARRSQTKQ